MSSPKKRICMNCGAEYYPTASTQKYCVSCRLVSFLLTIGSNKKKKLKPLTPPKKNDIK